VGRGDHRSPILETPSAPAGKGSIGDRPSHCTLVGALGVSASRSDRDRLPRRPEGESRTPECRPDRTTVMTPAFRFDAAGIMHSPIQAESLCTSGRAVFSFDEPSGAVTTTAASG